MNVYERNLLHQILANQIVIMTYLKHPTKESKEYDKTKKILKEFNKGR